MNRTLWPLTNATNNVVPTARALGREDLTRLGIIITRRTATIFIHTEIAMRKHFGLGTHLTGLGARIASPLLFRVKQHLKIIQANHATTTIIHRDINSLFFQRTTAT